MAIEFYDREDGSGVKYTPRATMRETISPILADLGCGWGDVEGMSVSINYPDSAIPESWLEMLDIGRYRAKPEHIADLLDYANGRPWGLQAGGTGVYNVFEATIWLPGNLVTFYEGYVMGEYVHCNVLPVKAPAEHRVDLSEQTPRP